MIFIKQTLLTVLFTISIFFLSASLAQAADTIVFDSTDNYLGGCQLTDRSEWELTQDIQVSTFQIWYSWDAGETTLPVKIYKDGAVFAEFESSRTACDPYQRQWCNADYKINMLFPKGKYTTSIPSAKQCLKPGGTGTVRLYTDKESVVDEVVPSQVIEKATPVPTVPAVVVAQPVACSCNQTVVVASAVGASSLISFLISFLLRKK